MKLKNLFAAAAVSLGLSFGAVFSSNAALIAQEFEFDGGVIEFAALTENGDEAFNSFFWDNFGFFPFEYLNIIFTEDFSTSDIFPDQIIEAGEYSTNDGVTFFDSVFALSDELPDDANGNPDIYASEGFDEIFASVLLPVVNFGEVPFLFQLSALTTGGYELFIANDDTGEELLIDEGNLRAGQVRVNTPAALSLFALGFIALLLRRRV